MTPYAPETPKRIQLSRRKGWRKPLGAVVVARPSRWGNPCRVHGAVDRAYAAEAFNQWLNGCRIATRMYGSPPSLMEIRRELAGLSLACWCPLSEPCHADALLHLANAESHRAALALLARWRIFPTYTPEPPAR